MTMRPEVGDLVKFRYGAHELTGRIDRKVQLNVGVLYERDGSLPPELDGDWKCAGWLCLRSSDIVVLAPGLAS